MGYKRVVSRELGSEVVSVLEASLVRDESRCVCVCVCVCVRARALALT